MENASKALIFAASVLISVMIIAVAVYIFQKGQNLSNTAHSKSETAEIQSFNAQFSSYETVWPYGNTFSDENVRFVASSNLNTISDVISAANLASSINYQNNYGYGYYESRGGYVETINAVEVIVDLTNNAPEGLYKYYLIEPNQKVETDYIYGTNNLATLQLSEDARSTRISNFSVDGKTRNNDLLKALNETKLVMYNNSNYTLYKYYFTGEYEINNESGLINSVKFTLVCDTGFDSL